MSLAKEMSKLLVNERVADEERDRRLAICEGCEHLKEKTRQCELCGCYVDSKTAARRHFDIKKMAIVDTHCDAGKW